MRRLLADGALLVAAGLVAVSFLGGSGCDSATDEAQPGAGVAAPPVVKGDAVLAIAFEKHANDLQVEGQGTVVRILADDMEGGRHQRFIACLASGQTLLVAHNIDVAARVEDLRVGDVMAFRGVYEWNEEGGTIHWTHRDPIGEHALGWILHGGRTYQ